MTPKEKAKELFNKYEKKLMYDYNNYYYSYNLEHCKQCALIAVAEILSETEERDGMRVINNPYWLEVRNEIEKL
jgi:hypothetical protein